MDAKKKLVELIVDKENDLVRRIAWFSDTFRIEEVVDHLIANGVTVQGVTDNNVGCKWIPASEPPTEYRDEYGELIPFLVCEEGTEYPFRAMYDGKVWGDGFYAIPVTHWMPLPQPPKGE